MLESIFSSGILNPKRMRLTTIVLREILSTFLWPMQSMIAILVTFPIRLIPKEKVICPNTFKLLCSLATRNIDAIMLLCFIRIFNTISSFSQNKTHSSFQLFNYFSIFATHSIFFFFKLFGLINIDLFSFYHKKNSGKWFCKRRVEKKKSIKERKC